MIKDPTTRKYNSDKSNPGVIEYFFMILPQFS